VCLLYAYHHDPVVNNTHSPVTPPPPPPPLGTSQTLATGLGLVRQSPSVTNNVTAGFVVSFVMPGSPAADAGVQEGDLLLELDGQPTNGLELR
jgi:S1-C subfamily serine protease